MDVLIILVFVSLVLVCGGILLLLVSLHQQDFEHAERLSLLPLQERADIRASTTSVAVDSVRPPSTNQPSPPNH